MKTLFLITARGGSKGIPGKNIRPFAGLPLICHAIDQARAFAADCDICLSTDSDEIADVARAHGLDVPFMRPAELATDTASSHDVILHAWQWYHARGISYDRIVLLQPTSPLRTVGDIGAAIDLWRPDLDMVVSVCESAANPYYNLFEAGSDGFLRISKGEGGFTRRQDAPKVWQYNGAVYVITAASLLRSPMSGFRHILPSPMPADRSVDLDSETDWIIAEQLFRLRPEQTT